MRILLFFFFFTIIVSAAAQNPAKRLLIPKDVYLLKSIDEAHVSPDGKWVIFTVSNEDSVKDKGNSNLWMVSWDGKQNVQLTYSNDGESKPKWSPDGKYISCLLYTSPSPRDGLLSRMPSS